jgi:predicted nucleic acid-binding protein
MIVVDTSSLISLTTADSLDLFLTEFDVHTTETVLHELEETAEYDDIHGEAAKHVLRNQGRFTVHEVPDQEFQSSRIDKGEASCIILTQELEADFLITDDLRALPEIQTIVDNRVAISPIVLKALVQRGVLEQEEAVAKLEKLAETRDWLGAPIYRRAKNLFDTET